MNGWHQRECSLGSAVWKRWAFLRRAPSADVSSEERRPSLQVRDHVQKIEATWTDKLRTTGDTRGTCAVNQLHPRILKRTSCVAGKFINLIMDVLQTFPSNSPREGDGQESEKPPAQHRLIEIEGPTL